MLKDPVIRTVAIVSLSSGVLGESFIEHELDIGLRRMKDYGVKVKLMEHALSGLDYTAKHPEARAADLLAAFRDPEVDAVICAIGGDDTYRLLPYLFENDELKKVVCRKHFLGFSDTTYNHFMLHKLGLPTFYGQAFLSDVCELDKEMLPYTRQYFEEFLTTGTIRQITPSPLWYTCRTDYSPNAVGTAVPSHKNSGFELLQGPSVFSGPILGGCIDSMYDIFVPYRYADCPVLCEKYGLFPTPEDWRGRILLLESSEEEMPPEKYRDALLKLRNAGVFGAVSGILMGKPQNEVYFEEYKKALVEVVDDPALPILCNISIGHALPRCIMPFGVPAVVDAEKQTITFS